MKTGAAEWLEHIAINNKSKQQTDFTNLVGGLPEQFCNSEGDIVSFWSEKSFLLHFKALKSHNRSLIFNG